MRKRIVAVLAMLAVLVTPSAVLAAKGGKSLYPICVEHETYTACKVSPSCIEVTMADGYTFEICATG